MVAAEVDEGGGGAQGVVTGGIMGEEGGGAPLLDASPEAEDHLRQQGEVEERYRGRSYQVVAGEEVEAVDLAGELMGLRGGVDLLGAQQVGGVEAAL